MSLTANAHPITIAIAGPSGSGKSVIAKQLAKLLAPLSPVIVGLDSFYNPLTHLSPQQRAEVNFDHPDALDWPCIVKVIRQLYNQESAELPIYDFTVHDRKPETVTLSPGGVLIIEGIFALYNHDIRDLLDLGVYVQAPEGVALARRISRDMVERKRERTEVIKHYETTVKPMYIQYVAPTRHYADVVLDGTKPVATSVEWILSKLESEATPQ